MLNTTYFKNIETLEDLKKQYRALAMQNHPDRGGDAETMKAINNEYDELLGNPSSFSNLFIEVLCSFATSLILS